MCLPRLTHVEAKMLEWISKLRSMCQRISYHEKVRLVHADCDIQIGMQFD